MLASLEQDVAETPHFAGTETDAVSHRGRRLGNTCNIELMTFLLAGCAGLLRTMESVLIKVEHLRWLENGSLAIALPSTKTTRSRDGNEMVVIDDPLVGAALRLATMGQGRTSTRRRGKPTRGPADVPLAGFKARPLPPAAEYVLSAAWRCRVALLPLRGN